MRKFIYIILTALCATGCQEDILPSDNPEGALVYLSAIAESNTTTRTPYQYTAPNENEDGVLRTAIWASSYGNDQDGYKYPNKGENGKKDLQGNDVQEVAIHATANFNSKDPQLLNEAVYPHSGEKVFFIGLHPQEGWNINSENEENNKASFTFDGSQDLMFAPRRYGSYYVQENTFIALNLEFKHLLTWFKVFIKAENEDAVRAWGKIKTMTITSKTKVEIDLSDQKSGATEKNVTTEYFDFSKCTFSADGWLPLHKAGSDEVFPDSNGYTLTTTSNDMVAYVLCAPVKGVKTTVENLIDVTVPEYTLYIETDTRKIELPIDLKLDEDTYFTGEARDARGKYFTLNLTFRMGNTVLVTAQAEDWKLGGTGNAEL